MRKNVNGILLLDKPLGITSNGALQRIKHLFHAKKAGHTGSLDPMATGMLPLCFGEATKFSQFLLDSDKTYAVTAQLGVCTTTGDREGTVTAESPVTDMTVDRIETALQQFVGEIEQMPPMFSAIKVQGRPLYELARKGIEVERSTRRIKIFALNHQHYDKEKQQFSFIVHCSKGTYVRTLVEDIGRELGCGAHVAELRRTRVSPYDGSTIYTMDDLQIIADAKGQAGLEACLLPVETAVSVYPAVKLSTSAAFYLRTGQAVRAPLPLQAPFIRLYSEDGRFLGIGEATEDARVKPYRLLSTSDAGVRAAV
ncbi:MAG TPA: tRNA pseudouridine(55) synthase TruB [Gammaproteobacteria bacterium]|jgi:tRNA pseudouridine55 synthase|nr:tRNA pseudouridine(55) synthase TruB [Gammaproteobacteria bacterium]